MNNAMTMMEGYTQVMGVWPVVRAGGRVPHDPVT